MNGAQDLGGMQSFGPVRPESDEPRFHADWEQRVFAITIAMGASGKWNIDMSRAARESLPPAQYLASSYYEIWFAGLKKMLIATGLATEEEIEAGMSKAPPLTVQRVLTASQVPAALLRGNPVNRTVSGPARFAVGDIVCARQMHPLTHTRLPRYCRGRRGRIIALHGAHVFPDTNAIGQGEQPQWLYTVCFEAAELWGVNTTASSVCIDCWEPYLDRTSAGG